MCNGVQKFCAELCGKDVAVRGYAVKMIDRFLCGFVRAK